ncbi:hypothetical protein R3I94_004936 [Phoxinus phoxinus]
MAVMREAPEHKSIEEYKKFELEYLQSQTQLVQQRALLTSVCAETEELKLQRDERQAEELRDSQMAAGIQKIFDRLTGRHESVSHISDVSCAKDAALRADAL